MRRPYRVTGPTSLDATPRFLTTLVEIFVKGFHQCGGRGIVYVPKTHGDITRAGVEKPRVKPRIPSPFTSLPRPVLQEDSVTKFAFSFKRMISANCNTPSSVEWESRENRMPEREGQISSTNA